jgi:transcriptional accessory protein Tex/SPT6
VIHVKNLSASFVSDPASVVSKGQRVRAAIIGFNDAREQVELSLKSVPAPRPLSAPVSRSRPRLAPANAVPSRVSTARPADLPAPKRKASAEGRTVAEATEKAAGQLGLAVWQVTSRALRQPKTSLFGRTKQTALVEVTEL